MQKNLIRKTSGNVFLGHLGEWVFHIFLKLHLIIGSALPQIPFRILWIMLNIEFKPCAASKVELFVTKKFFMNVIGLLALTLKHIDKFRLRQQSIPSNNYRFTVSNKTLEQHAKYIQHYQQRHQNNIWCFYC